MSEKKLKENGISRRKFMGTSALAGAGFYIVPRYVIGGAGYVAPSDRLNIAGIGVGLTRDYGAAHILYIRRGYIPDGQGISWNDKFCQYEDRVIVDDTLKICFTKQLSKHKTSG